VLLVLAFGAVATWSANSRAADQPAPVTPAEQASKFYQQGNIEFEKKNWTDAESAYLKAWAITRTFDIAANLGEVEFHLGRMREAAEYLDYSLRTAPPSTKPAQRDRTTHFMNQAKEKLGVVHVHVNVAGSQVSINGRAFAAEDLAHDIFLDPGAYTVIANHAGYIETKQLTNVKLGTPPENEIKITLMPAPLETRSRVPTIVLGVASAASLGLGAVMTIVSNGKSTDAGAQRAAILQGGGQCAKPESSFIGPCAGMKSSLKSLDTTANVARIAYAGSGLLLIGAVTYALLPPPNPQAGWVRAAPVIGTGNGGIVVMGAW
jgi:tetratricopeptide (TPR) repeat protein